MIQCRLHEVRNDTITLTRGGNPAKYKRVDDALMGIVIENLRTGKRITLDENRIVYRSLRLHENPAFMEGAEIKGGLLSDALKDNENKTKSNKLVDIMDLDNIKTEIIK